MLFDISTIGIRQRQNVVSLMGFLSASFWLTHVSRNSSILEFLGKCIPTGGCSSSSTTNYKCVGNKIMLLHINAIWLLVNLTVLSESAESEKLIFQINNTFSGPYSSVALSLGIFETNAWNSAGLFKKYNANSYTGL